jgi:MoaA/NifB/PqqE/SkfB family radical SAM enzyme
MFASFCNSCCSDVEDDFESRFLRGILKKPGTPAKFDWFLRGIRNLDPDVCRGVLKTWIHVALYNSFLRTVQSIKNQRSGLQGLYPLDAMVSPFGQCNLKCRGCYSIKEHGESLPTVAQFDGVIRQLGEMNVYHILVIGKGEPFYDARHKQLLFEVTKRHPQQFFTVFTNGTNISDDDIYTLKGLPNVMIILSIDGREQLNDWRRGPGVYATLIDSFQRMQAAGLLFGYCTTVFKQNIHEVIDPAFVNHMASLGCKVGYLSMFLTFGDLRYHDMMFNPIERTEYVRRFTELDAEVEMPLIEIDGIESHVGCRAKHGSTIYVDAITGQVAPCIRVRDSVPECNIYREPHSDRLFEVFHSEFFQQYRENPLGKTVCEGILRCDGHAD